MKITRLAFILLVFQFLSGCANIIKFNLQDAINREADKCKDTNCTIVISHLTDFKWDKMYVFDNATEPDEISDAIGINYPYYEEFSKSVVFLYHKKIVHYENNEDNIETATDRSVIFDYPHSLAYQKYTPEQAKFKFKKIAFEKGTYYKLFR